MFYQNGSWEWAKLTGTGDGQYGLDNLSMIPFYCGVAGEENAGLNCGTENCWACLLYTSLVGRGDDRLDGALLGEGIDGHKRDDRGAVGIRDDALVPLHVLGVDLGNDEGNIGVEADVYKRQPAWW